MLKHEEQQELIERIISEFDTNIIATLALVEKELNNILLKNGVSEATALSYELAFIQALENAGYYSKVNDLIDNRFDELFLLIREGINEGGFDVLYTADDLEKITALKEIQLQQFTNLANDSASKIQQSLYKYVLSDASLEDIQAQLKADFKGTTLARYSTTLARTAIADFQQSVIDIKSQGLGGVWLYVGVKDNVTRDFCTCILKNKSYYDNSQKNSIMSAPQRKYNCRHRARMVSLDYAIAKGFKKSTGVGCGV